MRSKWQKEENICEVGKMFEQGKVDVSKMMAKIEARFFSNANT
jgi:hypothetical protein